MRGVGGVWRVGVYGGRGEGRGIREGRRGGGGEVVFLGKFFFALNHLLGSLKQFQ